MYKVKRKQKNALKYCKVTITNKQQAQVPMDSFYIVQNYSKVSKRFWKVKSEKPGC